MTDDDGTTSTAAEHGRWAGEPERFAMVAHGRPVGELLVAPRRPGTRFSATESRLLGDLAGQAALAAAACRNAVALQRAPTDWSWRGSRSGGGGVGISTTGWPRRSSAPGC